MKQKLILTAASALTLALVACIVPPSLYERASWGPPPEYWQEQGRYRQAGDGQPAPAEARGAPDPAGGENVADPRGEFAGAPHAPANQAPLYAWDGGVVDGAPQGRVQPQDGTPRGLETPPAGRMHIIELYQQVLDERDALSEEVELLRKSLEETSLALDAKGKEADELGARVAALEAAHKELMSDNQSIAARLVQAQIRRLESEKLLLETRIEGERAKAEESARAAAAQSKVGAGKSKPAPKAHEGEE